MKIELVKTDQTWFVAVDDKVAEKHYADEKEQPLFISYFLTCSDPNRFSGGKK